MNGIHTDELSARLDVNDARTAQDAGTKFARALADIGSADFMTALAEQQDLIQRAIVEAGFSTQQAWLAAEHFGDAARDEWAQMTHAGAATAQGQA